MANFDEDIKRISNEMLEDGTIDEIIRKNLKKAYEDAISDAFKWGDLRKAIEKRVESVLVPAVEKFDLSDYVIKLDAVLTDVIKETVFPDQKQLLENFKKLTCDEMPKEVTLNDILEKYTEYCKEELDCVGRKVETGDGEPRYESCEICVSIESDSWYSRNSKEHAMLKCRISEIESDENKEELNRTIRLSKYSWERANGYGMHYGSGFDIQSIRHLSSFDVWLIALAQNGTRIIADIDDYEEDEFIPDAEPECEWS